AGKYTNGLPKCGIALPGTICYDIGDARPRLSGARTSCVSPHPGSRLQVPPRGDALHAAATVFVFSRRRPIAFGGATGSVARGPLEIPSSERRDTGSEHDDDPRAGPRDQ